MKKVLFATTALVATAGVAAADVTFGGLGRFGIRYDAATDGTTGTGTAAQITAAQATATTSAGVAATANALVATNTALGTVTGAEIAAAATANAAAAADQAAVDAISVKAPSDSVTQLTTRIRLVVTATAESDNGLSFGAQIRYQADGHEASQGLAGTAGFNTPRFWVTSGAFTVSVGQVLGAIENMPGMYTGSIGLTGLGYGNVAYNFGADAYTSGNAGSQGMDIIWASGNWGVHLSHSWSGQGNGENYEERSALSVSYVMGNYTFALGAQDSDKAGDTSWAGTVGGTWGNFDGAFQIADNDGDMKYGIAGNYQVGSSTFIRGYLNHDEGLGTSGDENIGIGFQHRMGGGTFLEGGVADLAGNTRADLGLRFSF